MEVHSVIGGNGTIGQETVRQLVAAGCKVRVVQRHPAPVTESVATASADVFDLDGLTRAVEGSDVIYLIIGLPYDAKIWLEGFPRAVSNAVEAARRVGARLVYFDNVYMYGPVPGIMTEKTPDHPTTQKGIARARAARVLMDAVEKGTIRGLIARSADFYGNYRPFDMVRDIAGKLAKGRKAQLLLSDDKVHSNRSGCADGRATGGPDRSAVGHASPPHRGSEDHVADGRPVQPQRPRPSGDVLSV